MTMLYVSRVILVFSLLVVLRAEVVVDTKYGQVIGQTHVLHDGKSVSTFLGIPFAKPPVDELRWKPPEEPDPWDEPFIADDLGTACSQTPAGIVWITHRGWMDYGEDCLNLNVYTPEDMSGGPYPTMVWMYGGGYQGGANIQYPSYFLAALDVVVVVPNYRLGIIGFATTDDDAARGNYGMLDQHLALVWVQENIREFGGNPDDVTIFGESAGATSVGLHVVSPMSAGLFHKAIYQSGCEMVNWAHTEAGVQSAYTRGMGEQLDCPTEDSYELMDCLRTFTPRELRMAHGNCSTCSSYSPTVDGEGGFLPDTAANLRETENFNMVPEIVGINREDWFLLLIGSPEEGYNRTEFEKEVKKYTPQAQDPEEQERVDEAFVYYYAPWPHIDDGARNRHELGNLYTDEGFGYGMELQLRSHTEYAPTYQYIYAHIGANESGFYPDWLGTIHIAELPMLFGYPLLTMNEGPLNESRMIGSIPWSEMDFEFSEFIPTLWTNFAKYGDPTPEPVDGPGELPPVMWNPYTSDEHSYILLETELIENRLNYRSHEYSFWNYYLHRLMPRDDIYSKYNLLSQFGEVFGDILDMIFEYDEEIDG